MAKETPVPTIKPRLSDDVAARFRIPSPWIISDISPDPLLARTADGEAYRLPFVMGPIFLIGGLAPAAAVATDEGRSALWRCGQSFAN